MKIPVGRTAPDRYNRRKSPHWRAELQEEKLMYRETAEQLLAFIEKSPSCFHAIKNMKEILSADGFAELKEEEKWEIEKGGRYFVTRNDSSIVAFTIPETGFTGYRIMASHSDSPTFKIKENPEMEVDNKYVKLNVERYGGMLCAPWFDRPLSVAGRVIVKEGDSFVTKLVDVDRDLLMIPNLAIHMNREVNDGYKYNAQVDMLPLYGDISSKDTFMKTIAKAAGVKEEDILGHDIFLYNRVKGSIWGANEEFVSSSRLDDLQCAFSSLQGFFKGGRKRSTWQYTVCLTMRKWEAEQSRVLHPHSCMIHWCV